MRVRRQARDLPYWAHLDGADAHPGNPSDDADRLVEILGVDEELATQLFAGPREGTVGHEPFAGAHRDTGRR